MRTPTGDQETNTRSKHLSESTKSSWDGATGLLEGDVTVIANEFAYPSTYNEGKTLCAVVTFRRHDNDEEVEQHFSTGTGWEDDEGGAKARREDGSDPKAFQVNSAYGNFLSRLAKLDGARDVLIERGESWEAAPIVGMQLTLEQEEYTPYQWKPTEDRPNKPTRPVPVAFLGVEEEEKPKAKAAAKSSAKPAAKAKAAAKDEDEGGDDVVASVPAKLRGKLKKIALEADDHDDFMEKAFAIDGADEIDSIIEDDTDEGFFEVVRAAG